MSTPELVTILKKLGLHHKTGHQKDHIIDRGLVMEHKKKLQEAESEKNPGNEKEIYIYKCETCNGPSNSISVQSKLIKKNEIYVGHCGGRGTTCWAEHCGKVRWDKYIDYACNLVATELGLTLEQRQEINETNIYEILGLSGKPKYNHIANTRRTDKGKPIKKSNGLSIQKQFKNKKRKRITRNSTKNQPKTKKRRQVNFVESDESSGSSDADDSINSNGDWSIDEFISYGEEQIISDESNESNESNESSEESSDDLSFESVEEPKTKNKRPSRIQPIKKIKKIKKINYKDLSSSEEDESTENSLSSEEEDISYNDELNNSSDEDIDNVPDIICISDEQLNNLDDLDLNNDLEQPNNSNDEKEFRPWDEIFTEDHKKEIKLIREEAYYRKYKTPYWVNNKDKIEKNYADKNSGDYLESIIAYDALQNELNSCKFFKLYLNISNVIIQRLKQKYENGDDFTIIEEFENRFSEQVD
jgi:hypothetical protein